MKLSFKRIGEIKTFSGKQKLKEAVASALQDMLKEVLQTERKLYRLETWIYIKKGRTLEKD